MSIAGRAEYDPDAVIPGRAYAEFLEQEYQLAFEEDPDSDVSLGAVVGELLDIVERYRRDAV